MGYNEKRAGIPGPAGFHYGPNSRGPAGFHDGSGDQQVGKKETGIVEKLLHNFGFVQCCDRNERLFFHFSAYLGDIHQLKNGDEVQFQETSDKRTGKPIAIKVTKMAAASSERWSKRRYIGEVTYAPKHNAILKPGSGPQTEFGRLCFERKGEKYSLSFVPTDVRGDTTYLKQGDRVSFRIATDDRTDSMKARDVCLEESVPSPRLQGVVCSMKDNFGFIKQVEGTADVFFHFSEYMGGQISELKIGEAVEFEIHTRNGKAVATSIYPLEMGEIYTQFGCEAGKEIVRKSFLTPVAPQQQPQQHKQHQQQPPQQQQQQSTSKVREEQAKNVPDVAVAGTSEVSAGDLKDAIAMFTDHLTADNESETKETIQRQLMRLQEFISLSQLQHPLSNLQTNFNQSDWLKMQGVGQMSANEAFGQMAHPSRHQQLEQTSTFNKAPPRPEPNDRYHYTAAKRPKKSEPDEEGGKKPRSTLWIKQECDEHVNVRRPTRSSSRDRNGVGRGRRDNNRKRSHSPRREHQNNTRNHHHHHHNTNRSHKRRSVDREKSNSRQIRRKTPRHSSKD
ncbi:uncharacterized protein LOC142342032 isoform X2 [Convolutriloba macropyga]|uniref:uncharacterized protein LOC142342032 isoform X2 n=1 Tax=Convolutriloba macropyga TaxID=536237 RepID=UPI003F524697